MIHNLRISDFVAKTDSCIVDVRSPSEFRQGHIPGAISLPLFNDAERAKVGTLYKQVGKEEAILKGLELIGPRMCALVKEAYELTGNSRKIRVYCWRGGMRSASMAWLFNMAGIEVELLTGGYKAWRNYIVQLLEKPLQYLVLGGYTGSGKTEILYSLKESGSQIIDLEGLANHKGSSFGAIGMNPQPTQEYFENLLAMEIFQKDSNKVVWIEDESRMIGKIVLPELFWTKKNTSQVIFLEVEKAERIERLLKDYSVCDPEILREAVLRIQKKLGGVRTKEAMEALDLNDLRTVADITLFYYDKAYQTGLRTLKVEENIRRIAPLPNQAEMIHELQLLERMA
jgi:tRNA 2-selenouridine synthase